MSKFIGRRIVPKHDGVWDINKEYEELSIVLDKASGESYISRRPVPVGTAISDEIYWMQYSLYSAQIAEAVKEMEDTEARLIQYVDTAESNMNSRVNSAESLTNSNKAELNSRMDTLDKRLDANVSASTDKDKDYAAEVVDARVDEEGTKYGSVGSHIRAIGSGKGILKGAVNGSRLSFLDITPELVWTADKYISRKYGGLDNFSQGSNVYLPRWIIFRFHMEAAGFKYILPCPQLKAINRVLHFMMQIRNLSAEAITIGKLRNWHFAEFSAQMELLIYA